MFDRNIARKIDRPVRRANQNCPKNLPEASPQIEMAKTCQSIIFRSDVLRACAAAV